MACGCTYAGCAAAYDPPSHGRGAEQLCHLGRFQGRPQAIQGLECLLVEVVDSLRKGTAFHVLSLPDYKPRASAEQIPRPNPNTRGELARPKCPRPGRSGS